MNNVSRITLGTAQLGLTYGIANTLGKPNAASAQNMLQTAYHCGITAFDTAAAYGESESILGSWLSGVKPAAAVITKLSIPRSTKTCDLESCILAQVGKSLARLRTKSVWGLLFHSFDILRQFPEGAAKALVEVKRAGLAEHVGCSVYEPEEAEQAAQISQFDIMQLPINVLDRRWTELGTLCAVAKQGVFIFARSIYLQGLLFLTPEQGEARIPGAGRYLAKFAECCRDFGLSPRELAYSYVASIPQIGSIVVGAEHADQILELAPLMSLAALAPEAGEALDRLNAKVPSVITDPRRWPQP